jgi:hypothetical protein
MIGLMIELTQSQFSSLTGLQLTSLLHLTEHKYCAVWVDDVRMWVWQRRGLVYVSPTIAPSPKRLYGRGSDRVRDFAPAPTEITQAYLEGLGYRVVVKPSGFTVTKGGRVIVQQDDGGNVHARYALRAMAVNRQEAWEAVRRDYSESR